MTNQDDTGLSEAALANLRPVTLAKRARVVAGLSQGAFTDTYGIPIGTLRDWENRRSEPDATAAAYLTAITNDPECVTKPAELRKLITEGLESDVSDRSIGDVLETVRKQIVGAESAAAKVNRDEQASYRVPASVPEGIVERLEDLELNVIAEARKDQPVIKVTLGEL
jgi:DNA-binding transcriptional regulator YiaG